MRISAAFLADHAEVRDGRLIVRGGVWTSLTAPAFPASHPMTIVLLLEPSQDALRLKKQGAVDITGPDGAIAAKVGFELELSSYAVQIPLVVHTMASFSMSGRYSVMVSLNGQEQTSTSFDVTGARPTLSTGPAALPRITLPGRSAK